MTNFDEKFYKNFFNRRAFWYTFKRSVNDIGNLFILLRYLQVYENRNWFKNQKEYSDILIKEKILKPTKHSEDASANSRGIKKVFELLGFCYVDKNEKLQITAAGHAFLKKNDNIELYNIKTNQLIKYQINNPLIRSQTYKDIMIRPFPFLLEVLNNLENKTIDMEEFKLFVCRAHSYAELELVVSQINEWRNLTENSQKQILKKIANSDIYKSINGYASYSLIFFGKSSFTEINEFEDKKILYIKNSELLKVKEILKNKSIQNYNHNLADQDNFINYYGSYYDKIDHKLKNLRIKKVDLSEKHSGKKSYEKFIDNQKKINDINIDKITGSEKEKIILNKKIEDLFFLTGRTLNTLKNEQIIYLKDLLMWDINNLQKMQGMGKRSVDELIEQLEVINRKNNCKLSFYYTGKDVINLNANHKNSKDEKKIIINLSNENIKITSDKFFYEISDNDKINFFRPIQMSFDNERVFNICKNLNLKNLGDLHQTDKKTLIQSRNSGKKSIELIYKVLNKYINLPYGSFVEDWDEIKNVYEKKYKRKLDDKILKENKSDFKNIEFLEDELDLLKKKINFKRQDIIDYHYGLDGSGQKTLQTTGDYFKITRERVRQITSKYLKIIERKEIKGLKIFNKINDLLKELCPIQTVTFEQYLIENKIVKKRFATNTILSLLKHYIKINNFITYEERRIIDSKNDPKYRKILNYFSERNLNSFGLININFVSKKFNIHNDQLFDLLKLKLDLSIINNTWVYDNYKKRNRLYNLLQKIFNVNSKVNKFQILDALKRNRRLNTPNLNAIILYCIKELNAVEKGANIIVPKKSISQFFYDSKYKILSEIDQKIINCFENDKILTYKNLVSKLLDVGVNVSTAHIYASSNTPVLIKVRPGCYSLVGTEFYPNEKDEFYEKNKNKKGEKIRSDYDHNADGRIWVGYEINSKTRDRRNFRIENSIYDVLKGDYKVEGMNHKIKINNQKYISKLANDLFKDKIKIGDEIIFTFDVNSRKVDIEIGKNLMKNKYN